MSDTPRLKCTWLGNGFVRVQSETYGEGNDYDVDLNEKPPTCPCENYTLGGNVNCKHVRDATLFARSLGYPI